MQIQKKDIKALILQSAREEFIKKGFKDASMRDISQKSGVVLSNIYNYFTNKDEIFQEVLSGLLKTLDQLIEEHNSDKYININIFNSKEYIHLQIKTFVSLINNYKEDFNLLLFKSSGSSLSNYQERYTNLHTQLSKEYIQHMKTKYPSINSDISDFYLHTMSSCWMSTISELAMHDLSEAELEKFIKEYIEFSTAGWGKLFHIHD